MSHNRNHQNTTPSYNQNQRQVTPQARIMLDDSMYNDAPQVIKAKAQSAAKVENISVTEAPNGTFTIVADLKRLRPTKAAEGKSPTADLYATGTIKLASGQSVNINITRRYQASDGASLKCENANLRIHGNKEVTILVTPKLIGPSSTGVTNLYAKVNGSFQVEGRGIFNVTMSVYKKIGV